MGRVAGVGFAFLLLGLAAGFSGFGAYLSGEVEASDTPAGVSPSGFFDGAPQNIDPACLWPVLDAALTPDAHQAPGRVPLHGCAPEGSEEETTDGWVRVSLQPSDQGEAQFERRFSGARVVQVTGQGRIVIETYDNWGGSGVFSSLVTGQLRERGDALTDIVVQPFGDRCNGGLAGVDIDSSGRLVASANMTPWDILVTPLADLPVDAQWDVGKVRFGRAFEEASSCAICCSAVTREYLVGPRGDLSNIGLRFDANTDAGSDDPVAVCLGKAVEAAAGEDGLVSLSEHRTLDGLIDGCARDLNN